MFFEIEIILGGFLSVLTNATSRSVTLDQETFSLRCKSKSMDVITKVDQNRKNDKSFVSSKSFVIQKL